jgi:hypothetical protein
MTVWVVTATYDPYGCGCYTLNAICKTKEIAERMAKELEEFDQMISTDVDEMAVIDE